MDKIIGLVTSAPGTKVKKDDNFVDRLNSRYTIIILVVFALVVTTSLWVGNAITCWMPVHFTGSHSKFTNSYCWVRNTYYLPYEDEIPRAHEHEKRQVIPYYQWIPFILLGQAVFFYLPSIVWHGLNQKAGVDADNILEAANSFTKAEPDTREKKLKLVTNQFHRFLTSRVMKYYQGCHCDAKHIFTNIVRPCGTRFGNYLVLLYMFTKLLYIANVVAQLFVMNAVLATRFNIYGFQVIEYLSGADSSTTWHDQPGVAFPRVTMCDFNVRRLGNVHRYTVQCTLPLNMYNEKIYMFLWFWFVFVAIMTCLDFVVWLMRYFMYGDKIKFLSNHLNFLNLKEVEAEKPEVKEFCDNYLRQDGVFLLRLIGHNTTNITVTEITVALWKKREEWLQDRRNRGLSTPSSAGGSSDGTTIEDGKETLDMKPLTENEEPLSDGDKEKAKLKEMYA